MRSALYVAWLLSACAGGTALGAEPATPPELTIDITVGSVSVHGAVSSSGHETVLRDTLTRYFPDRAAEIAVSVHPAPPPGWALVTDVTLEALAVAQSARASITVEAVSVRGITGDGPAWRDAASRIDRALLPGMRFEDTIVEIGRTASMQVQCLALFRTAMRGRRVEFEMDSAELGTAAMPLLDELIQIAADCPDSRLEISGHTDGSGNETANVLLSQARADAVAAYFVAGGIAAQRISARGAGSAEPLADDRTTQGRRLNRRIAIELRFPGT